MLRLTALFFVFLSLILSNIAQSQSISTENIYRSKDRVVIDGLMDEAVWKTATVIDVNTVIKPYENTKAPVKTKAYLYETGESLVVAVVAEDPNPRDIRAAYRDRDKIQDDDSVSLIIDTFNDQRRAFVFSLNPLGVQRDLIQDQTQLTEKDESWDAIWHGAGKITEKGYVLEFEIPFRALRFPKENRALTWGIEISRIFPRSSRMEIVSTAKERGNNCFLCQVPKYSGFENLTASKDVLVTPFTVASRQDRKTVNANKREWINGDFDYDIGADIRWGINQDTVLNATINPDFSQVEADTPQLNINKAFSLFFPEKRTFFLDGANYFKTTIFNLVHTRNISSPNFGAKLTGKTDKNLYGVMAANDDLTSFLLPSSQSSQVVELSELDNNGIDRNVKSNVAVARYRRDIGQRSNAGILVARRSAGNYDNLVSSVDGIYKWDSSNRINYQLSYSDTDNSERLQERYGLDESQSGVAYQVHYQHSKRDFDITGGYMNFDEGFRSDLGFITRVDYKKGYFGGAYRWYGEENAKITRFGVRGDWDKTYDQSGEQLEEEVEAYFFLDGPMQFFGELGVIARDTFWQGKMHDEMFMTFTGSFIPDGNIKFTSNLLYGQVVDFVNNQEADSTVIRLGGEWKYGQHVSGTTEYLHQFLSTHQGRLFEVNQLDLRTNFQLDLAHSVRIVFTYTDIERNNSLYSVPVDQTKNTFNTQVVYAYEPNPQTVAFIGYSDRGLQNDERDRIVRDERSLFVKLSYAFQL